MNISRAIRCPILFALVVTILSGCAKEKPPVPQPTVFAFTNIDETIPEEEINVAERTKSVVADFNLDGLKDLAILEHADQGRNEVSIYIRKQDLEGGQATIYYKGGAIRRPVEGKIVGIASRVWQKYTDLVLLIAYTNRGDEMVHYRNNGARFTELRYAPPRETDPTP